MLNVLTKSFNTESNNKTYFLVILFFEIWSNIFFFK
jgi:hypothetical protein